MRRRAYESFHDSVARNYLVSKFGKRVPNRAYAVPQKENLHYEFVLYDDSVGIEVPSFGRLIHTRDVNSLPGGIIVVPLSLFAVTANEAEFSSAIARVIAHEALAHPAVTAQQPSPWSRPSRTLLFTRAA